MNIAIERHARNSDRFAGNRARGDSADVLVGAA